MQDLNWFYGRRPSHARVTLNRGLRFGRLTITLIHLLGGGFPKISSPYVFLSFPYNVELCDYCQNLPLSDIVPISRMQMEVCHGLSEETLGKRSLQLGSLFQCHQNCRMRPPFPLPGVVRPIVAPNIGARHAPDSANCNEPQPDRRGVAT